MGGLDPPIQEIGSEVIWIPAFAGVSLRQQANAFLIRFAHKKS